MGHRKQIFFGIILGLILPFILSVIYFLSINPGYGFADYFKSFFVTQIMAPILSVCLVGNLGLFFLLLKLEKESFARGVVFATLLVGVIIFILKVI